MADILHTDFYADQVQAEMADLSLEERGAYITLCTAILGRGHPITQEHFHKLCGRQSRTVNRVLAQLIDLGKVAQKEGKLCVNWCEKALKNARKRIEVSQKNGQNGGRFSNENNDIEKPAGFSTRAHNTSNQKTSNQNVSEANASAIAMPMANGRGVKSLFDRGLVVLGRDPGTRSLLGKFRKHYGDVLVLEAIAATEEAAPGDPRAYFIKCCQTRKGYERSHAHAVDVLARAAIELDEQQDGGSYYKTTH